MSDKTKFHRDSDETQPNGSFNEIACMHYHNKPGVKCKKSFRQQFLAHTSNSIIIADPCKYIIGRALCVYKERFTTFDKNPAICGVKNGGER